MRTDERVHEIGIEPVERRHFQGREKDAGHGITHSFTETVLANCQGVVQPLRRSVHRLIRVRKKVEEKRNENHEREKEVPQGKTTGEDEGQNSRADREHRASVRPKRIDDRTDQVEIIAYKPIEIIRGEIPIRLHLSERRRAKDIVHQRGING